MFKLWQLFLDRVNPLSRVIHAPSVQQLVLEASGNLKIISRSAEALLFAIYSTAVMSINPTECQQLFDGDKRTLLGRYQFAAQQALINAGLLRTSDLQVLQTFVIYLVSIIPLNIKPKFSACDHKSFSRPRLQNPLPSFDINSITSPPLPFSFVFLKVPTHRN